MTANPRRIFAVLLLFALVMGLRLNAPRADLPADISFSGSVYTDEGNQCHNSRSRLLHGTWYPDDWRITHYNPVVPYLKYGIFSLFGVGLFQVRLVSHIFAFLSLLFFFLLSRSYFGFRGGFAATALLGFNFLFLMYNRIGTFETPMIFWIILSLFFLEKARREPAGALFWIMAGGSAYMAFIFKNTAAHFVPVPLAAVLLVLLFGSRDSLTALRGKGWWRPLLCLLAGLVGVFSLWLVLFYLPNREWIWNAPGRYIGNQMFPKSAGDAWRNMLAFNWKDQFHKIPVVWTMALLWVPFFYRSLMRRRIDLTRAAVALTFFSHTLFFMVVSNRPTRYFIAVIPAMVLMTLLLLQRLVRPQDDPPYAPGFPAKLGLMALDWLWLSLAAWFCFLPLLARVLPLGRLPSMGPAYLAVTLIITALGHGVSGAAGKRMGRAGGRRIRCAAALLILLLSVAVALTHYLRWNATKTHTVYHIARKLDKKLDDAYIAGLTAPVAVVESSHRSLFLYPRFVNWEPDTLQRYGITHSLLASFNREINLHFSAWPKIMARAKLLDVYNVKEQFLHLYSLVDPVILDASPAGRGRIRLTVENRRSQTVRARFGYVSVWLGEDEEISRYAIETGERGVRLDPGRSVVEMAVHRKDPPRPDRRLFFLRSGEWPLRHRYEAEKFPSQTGETLRIAGASGGAVRSFRRGCHRPGYLTFGPFIPYSRGFMIIDFHLQVDNIRRGLYPLVRLDVTSYRDKISIASRDIRSADVVPEAAERFRLGAVLADTRVLEFRCRAVGWADVMIDAVDVTYYQGLWKSLEE